MLVIATEVSLRFRTISAYRKFAEGFARGGSMRLIPRFKRATLSQASRGDRMKSRSIVLTPDLVARVHRVVEDPGQEPGLSYQTDEDYDAAVKATLESHPAGPDTWLFAYGSLLWKPELEHVEARRGTARGWHRSFCFRITRHRPTKEQPGLMMALDRGGRCQGVLYRLPEKNLEGQFGKLFRREFTVKPQNSIPRWITVETDQAIVLALTFVMNRSAPTYVGRLPLEEIADILAKSCGHWGSGADYLRNTVVRLEEHGIRDRNLWHLQRLAAERIKSATEIEAAIS
jgi:cation transport protein ChaC